ncbi:MAG: hypothetical protein IJE10_07525 [Clostridia bacterium]|nr:hypothetical protein [Clostridia bacterium]
MNWKAIKDYAEVWGVLIAFAGLVWGVAKDLFVPRCVRMRRKEIKRIATEKMRELKNEELLFNMRNNRLFFHKNIFFKSIVLRNQQSEKKVSSKFIRSSYVVTGGPGCGKSSFLKDVFRRNLIKWWFSRKKVALFLDAHDIYNEIMTTDNFLNLVTDASLSKLILYLDGVDETIENAAQFEDLLERLRIINRVTKKLIIRISCRPDFVNIVTATQNAYDFKFYEIDTWNEENLKRFSLKILKHIKNHIKEDYDDMVAYFKKAVDWKIIDYNPLMCKMLISIKLYNESYELTQNKFSFYETFVVQLFRIYYAEKNIEHNIDSDIACLSKETYDSYYLGGVHNISRNEDLAVFEVLLKEKSGEWIFKHDTFYEFFVAYYFLKNVFDLSNGAVKVLACEYTNKIADFISDGLLLEKISDCISGFVNIYSCTFSQKIYTKFKQEFTQFCQEQKYINVKKQINELRPKHFFKLKYTIIFRLGRLNSEDINIKKFLEFVYYNDDNIINAECPDFDKAYNLIVLRRCCAISSSFMGGEKIELDYVSHMLKCWGKEYIENYDLVNRSHTLVYYGDVITQENDVINFKDDTSYPCEKSCKKRISRLAQLNVDKTLSEMLSKEKRIYYFRLFDIATLYTFIASRGTNIRLTLHDKEVIKNFKTDFRGASKQRTKTLKSIKKETVKLLNNSEHQLQNNMKNFG